jgi:hypothetical protein
VEGRARRVEGGAIRAVGWWCNDPAVIDDGPRATFTGPGVTRALPCWSQPVVVGGIVKLGW